MQAAMGRVLTVMSVGMGLAVVALLLSLVLHASQWFAPNWLPYRLAGRGYEDDIVQRIEAAEAAFRSGKLQDGRHLCAVIGLSGMREAADLKLMTAATDERCRFIGLSGAGGALDTLAEQARRLLSGSLRPDVAVVGVGEFLLIKPVAPKADGDQSSPWVDAMRRGDIRRVAKMVKDGLWFIERRRDVNGTVEAGLIGVKQEMLRLLGSEREAENNPLLDPWREMLRLEVPEHPSATALRVGIAAYEARGAYDPASFASERVRDQSDALNAVVSGLRARGSEVIVVLLPERSELRARIPDEGVQELLRGLREGFGAGAPQVINLRDAVPDSGFTDLTHVNAEGRGIFSRILAARIAEALPKNRRPLMSLPEGARP